MGCLWFRPQNVNDPEEPNANTDVPTNTIQCVGRTDEHTGTSAFSRSKSADQAQGSRTTDRACPPQPSPPNARRLVNTRDIPNPSAAPTATFTTPHVT